MCHKIKKCSNRLMNHFPNFWVKILKFDNYHPPPYTKCEVFAVFYGGSPKQDLKSRNAIASKKELNMENTLFQEIS